MSLTPLGNNQTNLQWRNAINNAFTVLETVSGITYELSGQNPDHNTVLIKELSAKAGKGLPLSGRVASLTISATADDTLIAELSGKAGKGTPLSAQIVTTNTSVAQKALSANTVLTSGVDVNLQNGNEFVISGSTNTPSFIEADGNMRLGAYETSAVSFKVLSGLVQAAPGLRFANFSNNVGQSNYIGGMNLNTAFNYSGKFGIIDIAGVRGSAQAQGVSGSYSVGIGSSNSILGSQVVGIGVNNTNTGATTYGAMVGNLNQLRSASSSYLIGKQNIAEGATSTDNTTLVGVANSGHMAFGESNRISTGLVAHGVAVGHLNTGSVANFAIQGAYAIGSNNVIGTGVASNLTFGNQNNNAGANNQGLILGYKNRLVDGEGVISIGHSNNSIMGAGSGVIIGHGNTTSGNSDAILIGSQNYEISATAALGNSNTGGSNVIIGKGNKGQNASISIGLTNSVSGLRGIGIGNNNISESDTNHRGSVALGYANSAKGESIALGFLNSGGSGGGSISMGRGNIGSGPGLNNSQPAISLGYVNKVKSTISRTGGTAIAIGTSNSSLNSLGGTTILGNSNTLSGKFSTAIGKANKDLQSGQTSQVYIGNSNKSYLSGSVIIGDSNTLSGQESIIIGHRNSVSGTADAKAGITIGSDNTVSGSLHSVTIGKKNIVPNGSTSINIGVQNENRDGAAVTHRTNIGFRNITTNTGSSNGSVALGFQNSGSHALLLGASNRDTATTHLGTMLTPMVGNENAVGALFGNVGAFGYLNTNTLGPNDYLIGNQNKVQHGDGANMIFGASNIAADGAYNNILGFTNHIKAGLDTYANVMIGRSNNTSGGTGMIKIGYLNTDFNNVPSHQLSANGQSIAIGSQNRTQGLNIAIGSNNDLSARSSTVIGFTSSAKEGHNVHVIGNQSYSKSSNNVLVGNFLSGGTTISDAYFSTILGHNSRALGQFNVNIGTLNKTANIGSVAIGYSTSAENQYNVALGTARAKQDYAIAMGYLASANSYGSITIGKDAKDAGAGNSRSGGSVVIGNGTRVKPTGPGGVRNVLIGGGRAFGISPTISGLENVVIATATSNGGAGTLAQRSKSVVSGTANVLIGAGTVSGHGHTSVGLNNQTKAAADKGVMLGYANEIQGTGGYQIAIGGATHVRDNYGLAIGLAARAKAADTISIGRSASAESTKSLALGYVADAEGGNSTAIGANTLAQGTDALALGDTAQAKGLNNTSIGSDTITSGNNNIAIGSSAKVEGATGAGFGIASKTKQSMALGYFASVSGAMRGVAVGPYVRTTTSGTSEFGQFTESGFPTKGFRKAGIRVHKPINDTTASTNQATSAVNQMGGVFFTVPILSAAPLDGNTPSLTGECALGKVPREMAGFRRKGRNMILDINIGGTMYGIDLGTAKVNVVSKTYGTSATGSSDGA